jgi:hypothetical protein
MTAREWIVVGSCVVAGTIVYSTLIVVAVQPFVSEDVFQFLNFWVTVALIPAIAWVGVKFVKSQRQGSGSTE